MPDEDERIGAGMYFCAICDGPFEKGQHVAVLGGGNSAGDESLFLPRFVDRGDAGARLATEREQAHR